MLYWIVLTSGGLLMCHANSDFEENLLKTTIFRDPTSGWRQLMECKNDRHLLLFELSELNKWLRDRWHRCFLLFLSVTSGKIPTKKLFQV